MQQSTIDPPQERQDASPGSPLAAHPSYWQATVILVLAVLVARVIYLVFFCGYELMGDEAHYWEWSRHLSLSYYSKGPGIAWCIAGATALLGTHEWSIRLPAALFSALGALALARLTRAASGSDKAGFLAALIFCLVPAYQLIGQTATIDGPFITCWIAASWVGWSLVQRWREGRAPLVLWLGLGLVLGVGFLFKYTVLLLIPSLFLFAWLARRELRWDGHVLGGILAAIVVFAATISPVIIWNAQHGWPAVGHEAGHLGLGGDIGRMNWALRPVEFLAFFGAQLLVIGPALLIACVGPLCPWLRQVRQWADDLPRLFLACCALPSLGFFLALSWLTPVEANWPIAGYSTLLALLAWHIVQREQAGLPARRGLWKRTVRFGMVSWFIIWFPALPASLPVVGRYVPMHRISGKHALAERIQVAQDQLAVEHGKPPLVISNFYQEASQLAFYLPGRPVVHSAGHQLGDRRSSYDYFPDTMLSAPQLQGRPAVLVGVNDARWARGLVLGPLTRLDGDPPLFLSAHYGGVRGHP